MSGFELHARLAADCIVLGDWPLCRLLLMNDSRWPWGILVPRRAGLVELHQLTGTDREQLWRESQMLSLALRTVAPDCTRLNVAALGNIVAQLHLHHVVRVQGDANWPAPVWGFETARPYARAKREALVSTLMDCLAQAPAPPA